MTEYNFTLSDKQNIHLYLPDLFRILHSNMSLIAPTGNSYEEDYEIWSSCIIPAMKKAPRQIVLMYDGARLAGYFQYYVNGEKSLLMMEEIQIIKELQGSGIFSEFYRWLVRQLPEDILYVEAYAHKNNHKSQGVLNYLGLEREGENDSGNSYYYIGKYSSLLSKYR